MSNKVLITGGLGYIGSALALRLLREGIQHVVLADIRKNLPDFLQPAAAQGRITVHCGDIADLSFVRKCVDACDAVFHLAALRVTRCAREPLLAHRVMINGTFNVALSAAESGVRKFVLASSAIVYGTSNEVPLKESQPVADKTLYGTFKIANENLLASLRATHGLRYAVLRYFNVYGPGMNLWGPDTEVLIKWATRLDEEQPLLIFGDGKQTLDWVYIDDIVEANWRAFQTETDCEIFNVCTGKETSILDLAKTVVKIHGKNQTIEFREARSVNQIPRRFGDPEKARRLLGFQAKTPLGKGLRLLLDWRSDILARQNHTQPVEHKILPEKKRDTVS